MQRLPHLSQLANELQKSISNGQKNDTISSILQALSHEQMSVDLLRATNLGRIVSKLKKSSNKEIKSQAQILIAQWKSMVKQKKKLKKKSKNENNNKPIVNHSIKHSPNSNLSPSLSLPTNATKNLTITHENIDMKNNEMIENQGKNGNISDSSIDWKTGVSRRDKVIENLRKTLKPQTISDGFLCFQTLAINIELQLNSNFNHKTAEYLEHYRNIDFNLKKNGELKLQLLMRHISVESICSMSSSEMANSALKEQRIRDRKWAMEDSRNDLKVSANTTLTDQFKCGKCKKRKCKYSQAQTRCADEPMTVFIACLTCGNRWKVN